MIKIFARFCFMFSLLTFFVVSASNAHDPDWKKNQNEMFKTIGLKAGDVIGKDNWKRIKGLVPTNIEEWVRDGKVIIKIGQFDFDASPDAEWTEYGEKHNVGKYALDKTENIIEVATGTYPKWAYGDIFPNIDFKTDPTAAVKMMHNRDVSRMREGCLWNPFTCEWVGKGGFERVIQNNYLRYSFWGSKSTKDVENSKGLAFMEITVVVAPYDVSGTAQLTYRKVDGSSDELYVYIPAIRRTKRMSGANRSDPFMGSDFTIDDGYGWMGQTSTMTWKYIEKKIGLMCISKTGTTKVASMRQQADTSWISDPIEGIQTGWQMPEHKQAPWSPVTCVWIPRKFHIIKCIPENPYYNMGEMEFWVDSKSLWSQYKLMKDIAGEYWRTGVFMPQIMEWDNKIVMSSNMHLFYDVKTDHATILRGAGANVFGRDLFYRFDIKNMKDKFSVSRLGTWTK